MEENTETERRIRGDDVPDVELGTAPISVVDSYIAKLEAKLGVRIASLEPEDQGVIEGMGEDLSALQRFYKLKIEELSRIAYEDELTGLPNRRSFEHDLSGPIKEWQQNPNGIVAFIAVDAVNFKRVNDSYGHDVGDVVLEESAQELIASALMDSVRGYDQVYRLGGDEFVVVVLLNGTKVLGEAVMLKNLEAASSRIFNQLVDRVQGITVSVKTDNGEDVKVSLSSGVAYADPHEDLKECLKRADNAMYLNKATTKAVVPEKN